MNNKVQNPVDPRGVEYDEFCGEVYMQVPNFADVEIRKIRHMPSSADGGLLAYWLL